jgi:phospholipid-binding lipoprotein MlaA
MRGFAVITLLAMAACTTTSVRPQGHGLLTTASPPSSSPGDPFEGLNRGMFGLGRAIDNRIIRPFLGGYGSVVPGPVRRSVHNMLQNLGEPLVFVNDVLQARFGNGAKTAVRFVGNSTIGLAGLFDPAARAGLVHHDNGFGDTLGRYGAGPGPYFYVPLLGPTDLRDAIGAGIDLVADPLPWGKVKNARAVRATITTLSLIDQRQEAEKDLKTLDAVAADPYATMRSVYLQSRNAEISGQEPELEILPELPPEPPAAPKPTPAPAPASPTSPSS